MQIQQSNRIDTEACTKARCNAWAKNKGRNASPKALCALISAIELPLPEHITCSYVPTVCPKVSNKREIDNKEARERTKWRNDDLCIAVAALMEKGKERSSVFCGRVS